MLVVVLMVLMVSANDDRDGDGGFERLVRTCVSPLQVSIARWASLTSQTLASQTLWASLTSQTLAS